MLANVTAVAISVVNFVIRMDDTASDVPSLGVYLSGAVVLILLYSGWLGGHMVYRHRVAVQETPDKFSGYDGTAPSSAGERTP